MSTPDGFQLYDVLGVSGADAAALWPGDKFTMQRGFNDTNDAAACIDALNTVVVLRDLRVGSDPDVVVGDPAKRGQITASATVQILDVVDNFDHIYYPRDLPDVGIKLLSTSAGKEPTVFFARDGRGWEVLIEGLPVELQWPPGLITPAKDTDNQDGDDPNEFDHGDDDSVAVVQVRGAPSYIRAHIRLHLTPEGDVIIEPNTPISIDSAKFANLPVTALHDVLFIPSPRRRDLYEWARNDFASLVPGVPPGAYGFRSILFDLGKAPFADLVKRFQDPGSAALGVNNIELVVEDVVLPPSNFGFPLPTHGLFGIRRKITDRNSIEQAFSLSQAPYKVRVYSRDGQSDADHTGLYLVINQLEFRTGSFASAADYPPVLIFNAGLEWQNGWDENSAVGGTLSVSDDWVLQAALTLGADSPLKLGSISDTEIAINTIKGGLRLTTLDDPGNSWQALIDVSVRQTGVTMSGSAYPPFKIMSMTGKPLNVILRDIGWSFGRPHLGDSIAAPEGAQLVFGGFVRLIVEELGFVEEPAGGTYFSFSGGVEIGSARATSTQPTGARSDNSATGTGIIFRRLRFLTSGPASLPAWKLDGIQLDIHYGQVSITGFGYITDDIESGYRYQEFGFGVQVKFPLMDNNFTVAAEFLKGSSTEVAPPNTSFSYLLASLQISWVPAGSFTLYAVRALFANNMQPALDPAGEGAQSMQLYQWHKDHDGAIDMPRSRNLADWRPLDDSFAAGIAVGFSFTSTGQLFHLSIFTLVTEGDPSMEILVVGELFLLKNPNCIGLLAVDYDVDTGKFGVLIGVNLGLDKFVGGTVPSWIADLAKLTGTVFFGNQPWTLAIGQLSDQRSWLGITVSSGLLDLNLKFRIALGLQIVDGGPKGFGVATSFTGGSKAFGGIGSLQVYGSLGFLWGPWKTGSDTSAVHLWLQFGIKMSVFYVFSVGLEVDGDLTYLTRPGYWLWNAQIHIDTPWFLPDVSFSISGHSPNSSQPMDSPLLNPPLSSGDAGGGGAGSAAVAMHVPALSDGNTDPNRLYSLNELNQVTGAGVDAVVLPDDLVAVAVDADIAITFTNPLANDAAIATQSYPVTTDPGLQKVQDLSVRYALKSVQIQRRPRFGGGSWTDLVSPVDTALDMGGNVHAAPAVSFAWDADSRADGVVSPNRLLINCRTPYSVVTASSQNDEEALGNDDGFPCCQLDPVKGFQIPWHDLSWTTSAPGLRLPGSEAFSSGGALWSWTAPPATMNGVGAYTGRIVAVDLLDTNTLRGSVDLTDPAVTFTAQILPMSTRITCTLTAYHGLTTLSAQTFTATANPATITLAGSVTTPITRVTLTALVTTPTTGTAHAVADPWGPLGVPAVMVYDMQYQSLSDVLSVMGRRQRCRNSGTTSGVGGLGKLAFLPNYDYAVIPTVELTVSHATGGSKAITLSQPSFFRTKGLPGLNATPNVGDELQPYVASTYPAARSVPLYRNEPVALAFTEDMSNLLPVDRVAAPGDPPEKAQLMQLALSVDRVASTEGAQRLTSPGPDWLTAHGGTPHPGPPMLNQGFATLALRRAASQHVQVQRFEAVLGAAGCAHDTLHSSQVLLHAPVSSDGTAGPWEAQANLRATVRAQDGPYTERTTFATADLGAFTYLADAGTSPVWTLSAGAVVAPGGGRTYAAFGDPDWNHFQLVATVDPADGVAGAGVGVSGSYPVQQGMVAVIDHGDLVLVRRVGSADQELARAAFSAAAGPITLHVTAFDDRLRAAAGDAVLEADRGPVREGRAALVSTGQAVFSGLLVESLDMYGVDFVASRYLSFADHIASRDPVIHQHEADAMGAPPAATPAAAVADHAAEIAALMTQAADPQQRQQLFSQLLGDIGLAQLQRCDRLTLTRLTDANTTTALLLESPEPLSILYDTTLSLVHHTTQRLPHPLPVGLPTPITNALAAIQDIHGQLVAPAAAANTLVANHDAVVLITAAAPDFSMTVYQVPSPAQHPQVKLIPVKTYDAQSATQDGFGALTKLAVGMMLAVRPDHSVAGAVNTMGPVDVPVAMTLLTDGDETATTALFPSPLAPGRYALTFGFHRTRWETNAPDPQAVYDDAATVELVL